jgi:hypothetical protein
MIKNSNRTLFLVTNSRANQYILKYIDFLSIDINFLYLDFSQTKDISTSKINHQAVNLKNISETIRGNLRNVDHIIVNIPLGHLKIFLGDVASILESISVKYSIITNRINVDITDYIPFDDCYLVNENDITDVISEEKLYFENFKKEYIRTATINDILNN